ncbi:hypothetical protein IEQ34_011381 [Dendrobium chrysotoxum]|uniref:Uncharacterized protein n=1 Tax=Dendrobium chrysotoxum TaxID=161865 RepID=A0AAV7GYV7_DENCH|nr:hypothetical protein IEQ34_011381 [Dendrobium chrysotoxum]
MKNVIDSYLIYRIILIKRARRVAINFQATQKKEWISIRERTSKKIGVVPLSGAALGLESSGARNYRCGAEAFIL